MHSRTPSPKPNTGLRRRPIGDRVPRGGCEAAIRWRLQRAKSEGDLSADTDPADLARYVATIVYGIAVQAAGGTNRGKLQRVVEMALRTLPL